MSAADAMKLATGEFPRVFTEGNYRRTDVNPVRDRFVPFEHSPRLHQIKYERSLWGGDESLHSHIQKHGLTKSNPIYVMRDINNPQDVVLTQGHHRVAAAHAIDPDMPIHYIDEGEHHSYQSAKGLLNNIRDTLREKEGQLTEYLTNPAVIDTEEGEGIRRTVFRLSLDPENIRPRSTNFYHWRDMGMHQ